MDLNKKSSAKATVRSAVVVLHELSTDSLILTQRSQHLRNHPGEISFPGGVWEEQDHSLYDTALRELYEELGIASNRLALIKPLEIERTLMGIEIHPWLAQIKSIQPYILNEDEVSSLIVIPFGWVEKSENYRDITVERSGFRFISCQFIPHNGIIWGATARIMKQLSK